MAHEVKVIHEMTGFAEILGKLRRFSRNSPIALLNQRSRGEIPLQVRHKSRAFLFLLGAQQRMQQKEQPVGFKLRRRVGQHFSGQAASGGHFLQFGPESGLNRSRQAGIGHQLPIKQPGLVDRRFLTQGNHRYHHVTGGGQVVGRIQQMSFPFPVAAGKDHPGGFVFLPHRVQPGIEPAHHSGPRF